MTKKYRTPKLALGIIGYLSIAIIIASFSFGFLYLTSSSIIEKVAPGELNEQFSYMLGMTSTLGAMVVFFVFFLLFLGKKIGYILSINEGVQILKKDLTFRVEYEGDDELAELAETINSFADQLEQYKKNEDRLKKDKTDLIRSLSHDIRTPLTAIISYADFIKNKHYESNEQLKNYIEVIQRKAKQIQDLTDLLLTVDEKKDGELGQDLLEGKMFFEQLISELEGSLEDKGFQLDIDKDGLDDFKIRLNVHDMTRVFDNLYSNIIKYADPEERIGVKIFLEDNYLTIIQTNRIKKKNIKEIEGHGIGLKSIEQIINKYEGKVNVILDSKDYKIKIKIKV